MYVVKEVIVINQVNLIGRVVSSPVKKGKSYSFLFVINDFRCDSVYFRCYSNLENVMPHLKPGLFCRISGSLASGKLRKKRFSYFVFVNEVEFFPRGVSSNELVSEVETFEEDIEEDIEVLSKVHS